MQTLPKAETIDERVWKGQQSWNYMLICNILDKKVRVQIKIDSYDFQSKATVELWSGVKWDNISSIPYPNIKSLKQAGAYAKNVTAKDFEVDTQELLRVATEVIK